MAKLRYNTVREVSYSPGQLTMLSDNLQSMGQLCSLSQLISSGPDPIRLAQVRDVIETVVVGRKYQVLLLRSQGRRSPKLPCCWIFQRARFKAIIVRRYAE